MKRKSILLCVLSLITVAALLLAGCKGESQDTDTNTDDSAVTAEPSGDETAGGDIAIIKDGKCLYDSVLYTADATEREAEAAVSVFSCLREITKDIKLDDTGKYNEDKNEIVVTNSSEYPGVAELREGLKYNDYVIAVSANKLIVTARSEEGLEAAATKLVKMILSAAGEEVTDLYVNEVRYEAKYRLSSFTVSGNDIKDYTIVYPKVAQTTDVDHSAAAMAWQSMIGSACGHLLTVTDDSAEESDKEILIGNTNREQVADVGLMKYSVSVSDKRLVVTGGGAYSCEKASEMFRKEYVVSGTSLALDTSLSFTGDLMNETEYARADGTDIRILSANILAEFINWNSTGKECPVDPRLEIFLANLYAYRPDVVTATEVSEKWAAMLKQYLGNGYRLILDSRENGGANYSLLIYNDNTVELQSSGVQAYTANDNVKCRNMGWGVFKLRSTEKEFAVISTHFNLGENKTTVQADEFNAKVAELSADGTRPVLAGGDFNIQTRFKEYTHLIDGGKVNNLKDVTENLRNDFGTVKGIGSKAGKNSVTIDYIFGTKDVSCLMFMTVVDNCTVDMSDHAALMADIKF